MTETTRACRRCGADISDLRRDAVWCRTCPKRLRQQLADRQCEICGATFRPRRKDAACCSETCRDRRLNRRYSKERRGEVLPRTCPGCSIEFKPFRSDQKYCTASCGNRARARVNYQRVDRQAIPCAYCGKVFMPPTRLSTVCSRVCSRRVSYARYRKVRVAQAVAWGKANKDARAAIANQYKAQRRALEKQTEGSVGVSSRDWVKLVRHYKHRCAYCGAGGPIHMEHVIPVSRGGRHAIGNVLPACESCNLSKQSCFVAEWKLRKARLARLRLAS